MNRAKQGFLAFSAFFFLAVAGSLNTSFNKPPLRVSKQESAVNLTSEFLRFGFAGHKRFVADALWIVTLLESDLDHYRGKDLNSWMYLRFSSISNLDPLFKTNYVFGGKYLSIVKDDVLGGNRLLERGFKFYPKEKEILTTLGFNHIFELRNYEKGLFYYTLLNELPDPPGFLPSLLTKLKHQTSPNIDETLGSLRSMLDQTTDQNSTLAMKLKKDIESLTIQRDLDCLNRKESECSLKDPLGRPYKKQNGVFVPPPDYTPYKLYFKKEKRK